MATRARSPAHSGSPSRLRNLYALIEVGAAACTLSTRALRQVDIFFCSKVRVWFTTRSVAEVTSIALLSSGWRRSRAALWSALIRDMGSSGDKSSSSSDEEDLSRFQSVAVTGEAVAAAATSAPSFKVRPVADVGYIQPFIADCAVWQDFTGVAAPDNSCV